MDWLEIKILLEDTTGLDRDALHIYGALAIQFGLALFFRKSLASPWPWLAALIAISANEYFDYQAAGETAASIAIHEAEGYKDMWNTMLLPTALMVIANFWPSWLIGKPKRIETAPVESGMLEDDRA